MIEEDRGSLWKPVENIRVLWSDNPFILLSVIFLVVVIGVLTVEALWLGFIQNSITLGSIAPLISALATILLAALTAVYVVSNKKLVEIQERRRELESESLRKGLLYEIRHLSEERILDMGFRDTQNLEDLAPTTVYQNNAGKIGLLEKEEIEAVTDYYHELSKFNDYLIAYSKREGGGNIQFQAIPLFEAKKDAILALQNELSPEDVGGPQDGHREPNGGQVKRS